VEWNNISLHHSEWHTIQNFTIAYFWISPCNILTEILENDISGKSGLLHFTTVLLTTLHPVTEV
jgi:hypothetical protein